MFSYAVHIEQYCTHSERSQEEYGAWSESYNNTFSKISRAGKHVEWYEETVVSELDIPAGDPCYVVWLEYSTGDSFGRSDHGRIAAIGVFKDYVAASALKRFIEDHASDDYQYNYEYKAIDGQTIDVYIGEWTGYFEHLDSVHIEATMMQWGYRSES